MCRVVRSLGTAPLQIVVQHEGMNLALVGALIIGPPLLHQCTNYFRVGGYYTSRIGSVGVGKKRVRADAAAAAPAIKPSVHSKCHEGPQNFAGTYGAMMAPV